jgi:hypothetical protein
MKPVVYGLGMLLLIVGAASGVAEVLFTLAEGGHRSLALGTLWYSLHANSLLGLRAARSRTPSPPRCGPRSPTS